VVFALGVAISGNAADADSIRTIMGVGSLWYAVPLVAGGARPFRRVPAEDWAARWKRLADIIVGSLLGAWTVQTVIGALPALSGLAMPIADRAGTTALIVLVALMGRYAMETFLVSQYPERLAMVAPLEDRENGMRQKVAASFCKAGMFVFILLPFTGFVPQLWIAVSLMLFPQLLGLVKKRFPNSLTLFRALPSGVPNMLVMMLIAKTLGAMLAERIEDPQQLILTSFVALALPGFALGLMGLFGRDGDDLPMSWPGRAAGALAATLTFLTIRGAFNDRLGLVVVLASPALVWWATVSFRAWKDERDRPEEEGDAEEEDVESAEGNDAAMERPAAA
jgi:hypothetical protein